MINVMQKTALLSMERCVFPDNDKEIESKADIIRYMRFWKRNTNILNSIEDIDTTIIHNLLDIENNILKKINKT